MICSKYGTENQDNAKSCCSCGQELTDNFSVQPETPRTSIVALLSFVLTILSVVLIIVFLTSDVEIIFLVIIANLLVSLVLGIIALVNIQDSQGRLKGACFAIASIFIPLFIFFIGFLLPKILNPPIPAHGVKQRAQLRSIEAALELFACEVDSFPPSDALDPTGKPYCGAMKLCEALMGQDLMGFHPESRFRRDGTNDYNNPIYGPATLQARKGTFLPPEIARTYQLKDIYKDVGPFDRNSYVLCDVFIKKRHSGKNTGMPILYYKADTSKNAHNLDNPDDPNNIYNYKDNYALLKLSVPDDPNKKHPLFTNPKIFYEMTKYYNITTQSKTIRDDTYILLSAGLDGLYGTEDDIGNFEMKWKPEQKR